MFSIIPLLRHVYLVDMYIIGECLFGITEIKGNYWFRFQVSQIKEEIFEFGLFICAYTFLWIIQWESWCLDSNIWVMLSVPLTFVRTPSPSVFIPHSYIIPKWWSACCQSVVFSCDVCDNTNVDVVIKSIDFCCLPYDIIPPQ